MKKKFNCLKLTIAGILSCGILGGQAVATEITITFENLSQSGGVFFTPVYGAFHNGSFDLFDVGSTASPDFERQVEDGNFIPVRDARVAAFPDSQGFVLRGSNGDPAPVAPGSQTTFTLDVDGSENPFFTFASMLIPSQDAFVGSDESIELFDSTGSFLDPFSLTLFGSDVYDGGTEANSDNSQVAFLNQTGSNQGESENNAIAIHEGLSDAILDSTLVGPDGDIPFNRAAADFTQSNFSPLARITVTAANDREPTPIPEPPISMLLGVGAIMFYRKRRRNTSN